MIDEELALFLLLKLYAAGDAGSSEELLLTRAQTEAWPRLTLPDLQVTLRALANDRLVLSWKPALASWRWKITDHGTNTLREKGLA